jgi:hypothetical protein
MPPTAVALGFMVWQLEYGPRAQYQHDPQKMSRKAVPDMNGAVLARAHGAFNVVTGSWPLLHMRSFERVSGPKAEHWLVQTVGGLLVANGLAQLRAGSSPEGLAHARRVGLGTALTLSAIDLVHAPRGRISKVYLLDAVIEIGWAAAWMMTRRGTGAGRSGCEPRVSAST